MALRKKPFNLKWAHNHRASCQILVNEPQTNRPSIDLAAMQPRGIPKWHAITTFSRLYHMQLPPPSSQLHEQFNKQKTSKRLQIHVLSIVKNITASTQRHFFNWIWSNFLFFRQNMASRSTKSLPDPTLCTLEAAGASNCLRPDAFERNP